MSRRIHYASVQDRVIRYGIGWDPRTVNGTNNVFWWTSVNAEVHALFTLSAICQGVYLYSRESERQERTIGVSDLTNLKIRRNQHFWFSPNTGLVVWVRVSCSKQQYSSDRGEPQWRGVIRTLFHRNEQFEQQHIEKNGW